MDDALKPLGWTRATPPEGISDWELQVIEEVRAEQETLTGIQPGYPDRIHYLLDGIEINKEQTDRYRETGEPPNLEASVEDMVKAEQETLRRLNLSLEVNACRTSMSDILDSFGQKFRDLGILGPAHWKDEDYADYYRLNPGIKQFWRPVTRPQDWKNFGKSNPVATANLHGIKKTL